MSLLRIVLDFESAYGKHPETGEKITLSAMTTEEYVRHPRFQLHGVGIKVGQAPAKYYPAEQVAQVLRRIPWERAFVICHHTHFDGAILSWLYGVRPAFWGCTLSMARALFPHESSSLANIAKLLRVPPKGEELVRFQNKWHLTPAEQEIMGGYCCNDVEITAMIFDRLAAGFPVSELRLIDWTVRKFTEPEIETDQAILVDAYKAERRRKRALLRQCVAEQDTLASGDKFAALLLSLGVDPPKKISPVKLKDGRVKKEEVGTAPEGLLPVLSAAERKVYPWSYAFGKADETFKQLLDHPNPLVQAVVEARLGVKSTIKETRAKRFYKIGSRGKFPIYLNYYGAHTGRWCLTGDTQIIVLRANSVCYILLPELRTDDLVWDGGAFVTHGGLVCRGEQEVITYDGITGTPGHKVFCEETGTAVCLSEARERGYTIAVAPDPPRMGGSRVADTA